MNTPGDAEAVASVPFPSELDKLKSRLSSGPSGEDVLRGIGALLDRYLSAADPDSHAALTNLAHVYHEIVLSLVTISAEVEHYVSAEFDARCRADSAEARVEELESEVVELKGRLESRATAYATAMARACGERQI